MRITANQVTFARLVMMPALCGLIYGGPTARLWAVIIGTVVGCTDFVDGYLARKHGPTVLGGLMDPIADKVFIAVCFIPYADRGWVAWWLVSLLFVRELLVTALRSSFELRQRQLKSTYLAKVKTWVQMCGLGVFMLMLVVEPRPLLWFFAGSTAAAVVGGVLWRLVRGRHWVGAWVFAGCFGFLTGLFSLADLDTAAMGVLIVVVGVTWVSAIDYVIVGAREVIPSMHAFDFTRLAAAGVLPILAVLAIVETPAPAWAIISLVGIEFAHGGLDNLLAHHGAAPSALSWGARTAATGAALGVALAIPERAELAAYVAFALSFLGAAATFIGQRRFYLEAKHRDKKRGAAAAARPAS